MVFALSIHPLVCALFVVLSVDISRWYLDDDTLVGF